MGTTAADLFAQSLVEMTQGDRARRDGESALADAQRAAAVHGEALKDVRELEEAVAANLAEKYALRQQLARFAPDHPLLKNAQLAEKVRELGMRAFAQNRNFDDARAAGETYFPPGTPKT